MSNGPWWRQLPTGPLPEQVGPGPGLQGPDYSRPRPPQPGESADLLPAYPGSQPGRAAAATADNRSGHGLSGDRRMEPYLLRAQPVLYSAGSPAANVVVLGRPDAGYRWIIHQVMLLPGTTINDATGAGATANFFMGSAIPGTQLPMTTDWVRSVSAGPLATPLADHTFTTPLQCLSQQTLFAQVTGGVAGYLYLVAVRVEQISDQAVKLADPV